ncbi:hypothetical protein EZV62_022155 [Acer yangbiense]|uniref:Zinc knuckle CX2CX4HX4C domain-containing protein n=1 Tax=Acer yangbiense TaxID=1000413 RepID=A0A5C7H9W8_9ROSI|nr:hypothetical protein EZV62_022155 [Acer yangbiense]
MVPKFQGFRSDMGTTELARLCENLSIKDEDNEIHHIAEDVERVGVEDVEHCLVGKVLLGKRVNREAFKSVIEQLWSPFGNVEIEMVEFWVQIHDIPIMCMNRRTAKWLAEQIGKVIEIPMESRECWGKFLRVKVLIDISKPLKRWLRLKLDRSENIVVVELRYERLPDFCYACGRGNGGSSVKERSFEEFHETENKGTSTMEMSLLAIQKRGPESSTTAVQREAVEKTLEFPSFEKKAGSDRLDEMCVDGPFSGPADVGETEAQVFKEPSSGGPTNSLGLLSAGTPSPMMEEHLTSPRKQSDVQTLEQEVDLKAHSGLKAKGKKWKMAARKV